MSEGGAEPKMIRLITYWAAWRLLRVLAAFLVIATLALLLLGGAGRRAEQRAGVLGRLQHAARPVEHQRERTLERAFEP